MKIDKSAKIRFDYLAATICDNYCRYPRNQENCPALKGGE